MNAIDVSGVGKKYSLVASPARRLLKLAGVNSKDTANDFWALREISFRVPVGESFGIIGANGSGKSTLLQIVAGVMQPTCGEVTVNGRISAILELGAGFNPEFSGRANVAMNAAILGLSEPQIKERFPLIEEFAEIGDFIDQPVKTYSSGMLMRLAFSVAVHIDPQVLIVDEALSVGDIYFTQRCLRYLHRLRERGITMIFVSHAVGELKALCDRTMWLDHGKVQSIGETDQVVGRYLAHMTSSRHTTLPSAPPETPSAEGWLAQPPLNPAPVHGHRYGNGHGEVVAASLMDELGQLRTTAKAGDEIVVAVKVAAKTRLQHPSVGFLMRNEKGETIYGVNTTSEGRGLPPMEADDLVDVSFAWKAPKLAGQRYTFTIALSDGDLASFSVCDYVEDLVTLTFQGPNVSEAGYLHLECQVRSDIFEGSELPIA